MAKKYRLEIDVTVKDKEKAMRVAIEAARKIYGPTVGVHEDGKDTPMPVEQFIGDLKGALLELVQSNPLFEEAGVEFDCLSAGRLKEAAVQLGTLGGKARARNLSKKRLSEIGKTAAAKRWGKEGSKA